MTNTIPRHRCAPLAALILAASTAVAPVAASTVVTTWTSTTSGSGQLWLNPANWSAGVPGPADVGQFTTAVPNSNTVNLDFTNGPISVGALVDSLAAPANLTLTGLNAPTGGGAFLLGGATVTVPFPTGGTETVANTVLSLTDTSTTANKNLTLNSAIDLSLAGTTNNILGYAGSGNASKNTSGLPTITVAGNITDGAGVHAGVTFLGGGTGSADGAGLALNGTNTFSGGLTIGNAAGTQGGVVLLAGPAALPGTGTVTVNEQGQLAFVAVGGVTTTYGAVGQNLVLNGIGVNKNISGSIRPTGGTQANPVVWQGNIQLGTSAAADNDNGAVLTTVASGGSWFKVTGVVSGGNLIEQGGGVLDLANGNNTYGFTQVGNGGVYVEPTGGLGKGDVVLFQTSTNTPTITLNNAAQTIGGLSSQFTAVTAVAANPNGFQQNVLLNGTTLTVTNPTANTTFGYGPVAGLQAGINDATTLTATAAAGLPFIAAGGLVYNSPAGHTLTLTGNNTYTGGTTINAGTLSVANNFPGTTPTSALGSGAVLVNRGGILASGGATAAAGFSGAAQTTAVAVTGGTISGAVTVNGGGLVAPGGVGAVGSLAVGSLTANAGSALAFDVNAATAGNFDTLADAGPLTLPTSGAATINVAGSPLTFGTFNLLSFANLTNAGTSFVLGTTPGGANRTYSLATTGTGVVLTIANTGTERIYSVGGSANLVDGPGTFGQGSTNFFQSPGTPNAVYNNADPYDTIFGNGGNGGQVTLTSSVRVGGNFVFEPLAAGQSYTFGAAGSTTYSITTVGGISASNNTLVNAPVILGASQPVSVDAGITLTLAGGVSGSGFALTKAGAGTLALGGTGTYTGGTVVSAGTLQTTTAALPAAGGVIDNATLDFEQTAAGAYAGLISGAGVVAINNNGSTGAVTLSNPANTYTGATTITAGTLVVPAVGSLGTGDGGLILNGGTLQAGGNLSFPINNGTGGSNRTVTLVAGTTSTVNPAGNAVILNQNIGGAGNLNVSGGGTLTLTGLPSTTVIGQVAVAAGTSLVLAPPANIPSFGFSASVTPGTYAGNLTVATPLELRLYGGSFTGGGTITIDPAILVISRGATTIGNTVVVNPANAAGFQASFGANANNSLTFTAPITGLASIDFTGGAGVITLGAANTYAGATRIDNSTGGSVALAVNNALPATTDVTVSSSGLFEMNGFNQTVNSLSATSATANVQNTNATLNSVLIVSGTGSTSTTYAGLLQDQTFGGTLGLTLNGNGSLALTNPELYSGPTTILGGRLDVSGLSSTDNTSGLGATSAISIGGGADPADAQLRLNGITGTVSFTTTNHPFATPPVITLNSLGGYPVTGDAGAIRVINQSAVTLPDNVVFAAPSSISVANGSSLTLAGTLSGPGTLISNGNGQLTLTAANANYAGGTEVDAGMLTVAAGSALGTGPLAVNGAGVQLGGSASVLSLNNSAQSVGSLSGSITAGVNGSNSATIALNGTVLTVTQTTAATYAGAITGTGTFTKAGPATLTLSGASTLVGNTNVSAGTLAVAATGSLSTGGTTTVATAASLAVAANTVGGGLLVRTTGPLVVNGSAAVAGSAAAADRSVLVVPSLTLAGTLDLGDNDLVVHGGTLATVTAAVARGYAAGTFAGTGLTSSAAAANASRLTTLGVVQNVNAAGTGSLYPTFDGQPVAAADVLVKYTYYGDANLSGTVDGADYARIDAGFLSAGKLTGWANGDFNYDGKVDASDYTLVDNAFNLQSAGTVGSSAVLSPGLVADATDEIAPAVGTAAVPVPEPTAVALVAAAAMVTVGRRRARA